MPNVTDCCDYRLSLFDSLDMFRAPTTSEVKTPISLSVGLFQYMIKCGMVKLHPLKNAFQSQLFEYETPKVVNIHSPLAGIIHRIVQVAIVLYIIVWVFIVNKGYQKFDHSATSGTTAKVKGISYTNSTDPRVGSRVWDSSDLVVPPIENSGFFITTNLINTFNQTQGVCAEAVGVDAECLSDSDCLPYGEPYHLGHGISIGKCDSEVGMCKVRAWCPIEDDSIPHNGSDAVVRDTEDFTVLIKNHIYFPYYKVGRSNILEFIDQDYLKTCRYHPVSMPYCPIFRIGDIVNLAESAHTNNYEGGHNSYKQLSIKGGVISIVIAWDCNLDLGNKSCRPAYRFERLDDTDYNHISSGFNFRYVHYSNTGSNQKRQLVKAFGILFLITIEAQARAFDIVTFSQNIGAGIALIGMATLFGDFFILYIHRKKTFFKEHIFQHIYNKEGDNSSLANESNERDIYQKPDAVYLSNLDGLV